MSDKTFYITTTLPYVNAKPHIGHALEFVQADAYARYRKLMGDDVFFNTGTDEYGQKIYDRALEEGKEPQQYVDEYSDTFVELMPKLGIDSETLHFIRTTDEHHKKAAQKMWQLCDENGDIYKAIQVTKYCVGCELEKTDSELIDGKCSLHPSAELEVREEENYFFRFSKYQKPLLKFYGDNPNFVVPDSRFNEIKKFVEDGLRDFSISRLKKKMPWGVPVPGDSEHIIYVWFDALTSYISTTGWPEKDDFGGYWPGIQFAGKDQIRQQAAIWQAMLLSAGLPNTRQIMIHGFITSGEQKMSKSLGNVIDPTELVQKYGTDATRYLLLRHVHPFEDTDVTWERLDEWYTANLVNGLGNLVARVMKMAEENQAISLEYKDSYPQDISDALDSYRFDDALNSIWSKIKRLDQKITEEEPFKVVKVDLAIGKVIIQELVSELRNIAKNLSPFMPETSEKIQKAIKENKKPETLFPRK